MKHLFIILSLLAGLLQAKAQTANPKYDKQLAESLGADKYGMRSYYLVILKSGTNQSEDKEQQGAAFRGHMENINRLVEEGKLVVAGPLGKNDKQYRGIFILAVKTKEEAEAALQTDSAVVAKYLDYEIYPWYGSAALPKYLEYHEKIEQQKH